MNIKTPAEADGSTNAWLADGEKYALIGLSLKLDGAPPGQLTPHLWALTGAAFSIPTHWQKWLGSIRVEEVEECNLFLLSKVASAKPGVVDAEDKMLQQRVMDFHVGLLLASPFAPAHPPVMLSGACEGTEIGIRQQQDLDAPIPCLVRLYPAVTPADIQLAARLSENLEALRAAQTQGGHWRLFRALNVYTAARTMGQIIDRMHQYCRAIDGLILSEPGNGKKQFRGRGLRRNGIRTALLCATHCTGHRTANSSARRWWPITNSRAVSPRPSPSKHGSEHSRGSGTRRSERNCDSSSNPPSRAAGFLPLRRPDGPAKPRPRTGPSFRGRAIPDLLIPAGIPARRAARLVGPVYPDAVTEFFCCVLVGVESDVGVSRCRRRLG